MTAPSSGGGIGGSGQPADVLFIDVQARLEGFDERMRELERSAEATGEKAGSKLGAAMSVGLGVAVTGAVALAGALTAVAAGSLKLAQEAAQNVNEFQSQLGASREEAEKLGTVAEQVFGDNWTGSLTEAGAAVATVRKEITGLADEDLRAVTGGVVAIAETFEQEQGSIAAAVDSLMKSTGISAQEATDFITAGFQKGFDSSGDFLDTLNEYAPQFEKSKIGAGELFSLLETGAAKGALGTDKIADAFKEFGLTVIDVNDDSKEVYKELGLSQAKLVQGINDGSITQAQAFQLVTDKLAEVKGAADRTRIGSAIFGGAGEDFANGLTKLDLTKTSLKELGGATDSLNKRYENFGNFFEAMSRQIQVALLPVGKELLSLANDAMPYLQKASAWLGERLPGWIKTGIDAVKAFSVTAINTYNSLRPVIEQVGATVEKLSAFIQRNKEVLIPLASAVAAGTAAFAAYRLGILAVSLATTAWTTVTTIATAASVALRAALTFITGPVGLVIGAITLLVGAGVALYRNWDTIKAKALEIWNSLRGIIVGAMDSVTGYLRNIDMRALGLQIVQGLANGILAGPRLILSAARGMGQAVIDGVKGVLNIRSPSVVMFEAGENTAQGLANGITKTTPAVQTAAARMAYSVTEEVNKAREALEQEISTDKWVASLNRATTAQLTAAQARARAAGDAEKYRALTGELERREDFHTAAVKKNAEAVAARTAEVNANRAAAVKAAAEQLAANRATIIGGEQAERYAAGLRSNTSAQLAAALSTARTRGEVDKYNAIKSEQARREQEATDATKRATDAAKAAADQLASNRKAITDGIAFNAYVTGLQAYSDTLLDAARSNALAAGDSAKYNAVLSEQQRRAEDAARAVSDLVDAQIKAANGRYVDTQGATDAAYRQTYGAGDVGLIRSLAAATGLSVGRIRQDVTAALDDAKRFAPETARIIERVYADALDHRKKVTAEQGRLMEQAAKDEEDRIQRVLAAYIAAANERKALLEAEAAEAARIDAATTARAIEMAGESRDLIVQTFREQEAAADDAAVTVEFLTGLIGDLVAQGLDPRKTGFTDWLDDLEKGSGRAAQAAIEVKKNLDGLILSAQAYQTLEGTSAARGTVRPPTLGVSDPRGTADPGMGVSLPRGRVLTADQVKFQQEIYDKERVEEYRRSLESLTVAELEQAQALALANGQQAQYNVLTAEITAKIAKLKDQEINVTFKIAGLDTGIKALDLYKSAIEGVAGVIRDTFSALASGAGVTAGTVLKSFGLMALGIVKQVAVAIVAMQAQLIAMQLLALGTAAFDPTALFKAAAILAASAAIAGIAAGLESRLTQKVNANTAAVSQAGAPLAQSAAQNASVSIPNSSVSIIAAPEWTAIMSRAVDKFDSAVDRFAQSGVRVTVASDAGRGTLGAFALTTP